MWTAETTVANHTKFCDKVNNKNQYEDRQDLQSDRLSENLMENFPDIEIKLSDVEVFKTNILLYMDDIKLLPEDQHVLMAMINEAKSTLKSIGLELNPKKSATAGVNSPLNIIKAGCTLSTDEITKLMQFPNTHNSSSGEALKNLEEFKTCKYLGFQERLEGCFDSKCIKKVSTNLTISLFDYATNVIEFSDKEATKIDSNIEKILITIGAHNGATFLERLHLPRKELGRGINSVKIIRERTLWNFSKAFYNRTNISMKL
ncbi:MAG: hypothetical protein MHPSP_002469, partial [Paramarteilia canceri]